MSYATVTAIGKDRVGIVNDLSGFLQSLGNNIEESRMALLGGEFAGILLVSGADDAIERLSAEADRFGEEHRLTIRVVPTAATRHERADRPYLLSAFSLDTPGIVHAVSAVLRQLGINIEDFDSEVSAAPWTGAPMFTMRARIMISASVPVARVKSALGRLEEERDLDIRLHPVSTVS